MLSTVSSPAIILKSVVFPLPEGPKSANNSPSTISKLIFSNALKFPKYFVKFFTSIFIFYFLLYSSLSNFLIFLCTFHSKMYFKTRVKSANIAKSVETAKAATKLYSLYKISTCSGIVFVTP